MSFFHGIKTSQEATSVTTPVEAGCSIPFVVGTAPVQAVGGKTNKIVLAYSYQEAVTAIGYSDDWNKYTLCEMIYSHFKLYAMSPIIIVNVLDPTKHKESISATDIAVTESIAKLPLEAIASTVVVKADKSSNAAKIDEDYYLVYDIANGVLNIEINKNGTLKEKETINVTYEAVKPSLVTTKEIIGGYNVATGVTSGLELVDNCYTETGIIPDLILAPNFSKNSEVAAIMKSKATTINGLFKAKALIDVDSSENGVNIYSKALEWKNSNNITDSAEILCWPMVTLGGKKYHMSVALAGVMAQTDSANDDVPSESPSNKSLQSDGLCLSNGTEVSLNLTQANYLNSCGIITAINFNGGFKIWGNTTAAYPNNTDVKDYFINVSRMFEWTEKNFILSFWNKIDKSITRRLIETIVDSFNIYLNGLTSTEKILGGRIECRSDENSITDLMGGKVKFHTYLTPPSPAQEIENVFEYDTSYIESALGLE